MGIISPGQPALHHLIEQADILCEGKTNRVVGIKHGELVDFDIDEALAMEKLIPEYEYEVSRILSM